MLEINWSQLTVAAAITALARARKTQAKAIEVSPTAPPAAAPPHARRRYQLSRTPRLPPLPSDNGAITRSLWGATNPQRQATCATNDAGYNNHVLAMLVLGLCAQWLIGDGKVTVLLKYPLLRASTVTGSFISSKVSHPSLYCKLKLMIEHKLIPMRRPLLTPQRFCIWLVAIRTIV